MFEAEGIGSLGRGAMPPIEIEPSEVLRSLFDEIGTVLPNTIAHAIAVDPVLDRAAWHHFPGNPDLLPPDHQYLRSFRGSDRRLLAAATGARSGWIDDEDVFDEEARRTDPIYNEFLRPLDATRFVAHVRSLGGGALLLTYVSFLGGWRPSAEDMATLRRFEIVASSVAARRRVLDLVGADADLYRSSDLLEIEEVSVFVTDGQGRLRETNEAARATLRAGDAFETRGGHLHARDIISDRFLQAFLHGPAPQPAMLTRPTDPHAPIGPPPQPDLVLIRDAAGRPRHVARVLPDPNTYDRRQVVSRALDAARAGPRPIDPFGLTAKETRVAIAIAQGHDSNEICLMEGCAPATLRGTIATIREKAAACGADWSDVAAIFG
ncbi:helix-turn-helix transcriptional regulator [Jannaschia sp. LMIT008]|uniref:helix-turn-helix transcriptional regulator n=1 Tax=Jannaschia maritima TaxID=3032585 RepID=UPI00281275B2|nr:helix-turn-helix transcriptional regulator [Jannaschia sp. LMIT008]